MLDTIQEAQIDSQAEAGDYREANFVFARSLLCPHDNGSAGTNQYVCLNLIHNCLFGLLAYFNF